MDMEMSFKKMTKEELVEYICDILYVELMDGNLFFSNEEHDDKGGVIFVDLEVCEFDREPGEYLGVRDIEVSVFDEDDNEIKVDYNFENYVEKLLKIYFE